MLMGNRDGLPTFAKPAPKRRRQSPSGSMPDMQLPHHREQHRSCNSIPSLVVGMRCHRKASTRVCRRFLSKPAPNRKRRQASTRRESTANCQGLAMPAVMSIPSVIMLAFIAFFTHRWVNGDLSMQPHAHYHPLQLCAAFPPSTTALPGDGTLMCECRLPDSLAAFWPV